MAHLDELHGERADLDHVLRLHDMELDVADIMLRQLPAYERAGQLRAVNRRGYARQHIRRRADVILVPVRNQIRAHALPVSLQIGDVGNHKVNTEHIRPREDRAAVHHNDVVAKLEGRHVFADLAQSAQRDNPQLRQMRLLLSVVSFCFFIFQKPFMSFSGFQNPNISEG